VLILTKSSFSYPRPIGGASRPRSESKLRRDSLASSLPSSKLVDRPIGVSRKVCLPRDPYCPWVEQN